MEADERISDSLSRYAGERVGVRGLSRMVALTSIFKTPLTLTRPGVPEEGDQERTHSHKSVLKYFSLNHSARPQLPSPSISPASNCIAAATLAPDEKACETPSTSR